MEGWGRQADNSYQEAGRTRQPYKKPPLGSWQQTVPSWEKKFCLSVGSVPWRKILETKKCMHLYSSVVNWNDSAGEEAFQNAKNRFYSDCHGLPCDIPLPDPNTFIDEVDWNSKIHPDVILDLESGYVSPDVDNKNVVIFGNALLPSQGYSSTGWGDNEEEIKKAANSTSENNAVHWDSNQGKNNGPPEGNGWVDYTHNNNTWCRTDNNLPKVDSGLNNGWEYGWDNSCDWNQYGNNSYVMDNGNGGNGGGWGDVNNGRREGSGWEYGWDNSCDWNQYGNNSYVMDNGNGGNGGGWGDVNNGRREGSGRYMSRYRTSRFQGHDNERNHYSWRNARKPMNMNTPPGRVGHQWS